jgi:hypothetical protein
MVMPWSGDMLGRSLQDLVGFLSELHALRIDLFLHQQGLDIDGRIAEFEREGRWSAVQVARLLEAARSPFDASAVAAVA